MSFFRVLNKQEPMNFYCVRSSTSICTQTTLDSSTVDPEFGTLDPGPVTQDTFMDDVKSFMTYKVAKFIGIHWFPILVPVGLVGNTLSFLVMIKPNNSKMSTCNYMAAISINDNIMMVLTLNVYLITEMKVHIMTQSECKFLAYLHLLFLQNSTFQIFAMTVDKFIAVKWPHKAAIYSTAKRARITAIGIFLCVVVFNVPHLFSSRLIGGTFTKVYSWLSFVINGIIPFALLIYMNFVIVSTVKGSRKMLHRVNDTATGAKHDARYESKEAEIRQKTMKSAENQLTKMLLLVTTLFLILLIPTYFRFIYLTLVKRDTPAKFAGSFLFFHITHKLYSTNNGINFFLYCVSGQKFRNDLKEILNCGGKSGSTSISNATSTTSVSS